MFLEERLLNSENSHECSLVSDSGEVGSSPTSKPGSNISASWLLGITLSINSGQTVWSLPLYIKDEWLC